MNRPQELGGSAWAADAPGNEASIVLARAFQNDPMMQYLIPDCKKRVRTLPGFLGGVVRYCSAYGEVHATPNRDGVACWLPPGNTVTPFHRMVKSGMVLAPVQLGLAGFGRLAALTSYMDNLHERVVPQPHWYLWLLGVEPARRGGGIGGVLLEPTLAQADAEGLPCYLETHNDANVPFYERRGFKVVDAGDVPGRGLRVWTMLRPPRT